MITLVAALGAVGVVLVVFGSPLLNRPRLSHRVEPYLSGLRGRPSSLIGPIESRRSSWVRRAAVYALTRLGWTSDRAIARRLASAGHAHDVTSFRLEQLMWGLISSCLLWLAAGLAYVSRLPLDVRAVPVLTALAFATGFLGRDWWLSKQIGTRRETLQQQLPTAVDLLALAVMSGESVGGAFERVARIMRAEIGQEFGKVVADVRAGSPVVEALEAMKERLPVSGISRLVDALATGMERGTPLADVLRAQADDAREARRRYLLELGGRREVLMLVPVVFLIMPVVVVFVLYPGLVSLDLLVP